MVITKIAPEFPGGSLAWEKYLSRNLQIEILKKNGAPPGKYTVVVSFTVNEEGTISNVRAENDPGYGAKDEAVRMMIKGPKWRPAIEKAKPVSANVRQSISFILPEKNKTVTNITNDNSDKLFTQVQIPAEFPGGEVAWREYLRRNLNLDLPVEKGAPPGKYIDTLSFIVDKAGKISHVKSLNDAGYGTKAEAIRVLAKGPKWKPAMQNGRVVNSIHTKTITWVITEE